jgi:hypothetical protein
MERKAYDAYTGLQDAARRAMVADVDDSLMDGIEAGVSKLAWLKAWLKGELLEVHVGLWTALVLTLILAVAVAM